MGDGVQVATPHAEEHTRFCLRSDRDLVAVKAEQGLFLRKEELLDGNVRVLGRSMSEASDPSWKRTTSVRTGAKTGYFLDKETIRSFSLFF